MTDFQQQHPRISRKINWLAGVICVCLLASACLPAISEGENQPVLQVSTSTADPRRFEWQTPTPKLIEIQVTRMPSPTATPDVESIALSWQMVSDGQVRVVGLLRNNTTEPIDFTLVRVSLMDHEMKVVAVGESYTILDVTFAREVNGFAVELAATEGSWASIQVDFIPQNYYGNYIQNNVRVASTMVERDAQAHTSVIIRVINESGEAVEKAQVLAVVYDSSGNLLDVIAAAPPRGYWSARETSEVQIVLAQPVSEKAASADAWAQGYRP
jgi:hypothetical protein